MPELSVYEGERGYIDYTLSYGPLWSVSAKRNTPVLQADVSRLYFYVKASDSGTAYITLTDASSSQIEWLSATAGTIRVKLGSGTAGHTGDGQPYELRIKLTDGSYVTAEHGKLNVLESTVDSGV